MNTEMGNAMSLTEAPLIKGQQQQQQQQHSKPGAMTVNGAKPSSLIHRRDGTAAKRDASATNSVGGLPVTPIIHSIAVSQLWQALDIVPDDEKKAYLDAKARSPALVEVESPPLKFLRSESFNPWTSARRLVTYWEFRNQVFASRATLSILQSGLGAATGASGGTVEGALTEPDLELLRSGSIVKLDRNTEGRQVLVVDLVSAAAATAQEQESALRCLFYLLSLSAEIGASQEDGVVILLFLSPDAATDGTGDAKGQPITLDLEFAILLKDIVHRAMPVRIGSLHAASVVESRSLSSEDCEEAASDSLVFGDGSGAACTFHFCRSKIALIYELTTQLGVDESALPVRMGGTTGEVGLKPFQDLVKAIAPTNAMGGQDPASVGNATSVQSISEGQAKAANDLPETKIDLDISRDTKRKKFDETESISVETGSGTSGPDDESSRIDFIRKRNALYSRRKYHRKKIEIEVLQTQASDLTRRNQELKNEGMRLEMLLQSAKHQVGMSDHMQAIRNSNENPHQAFLNLKNEIDFSLSQQPRHGIADHTSPYPGTASTRSPGATAQCGGTTAHDEDSSMPQLLPPLDVASFRARLQGGNLSVPLPLPHVSGYSNQTISDFLAKRAEGSQGSQLNVASAAHAGIPQPPGIIEQQLIEMAQQGQTSHPLFDLLRQQANQRGHQGFR